MAIVLIVLVVVGVLAFLFFSRASGWRRFRRGPISGRWGRRI